VFWKEEVGFMQKMFTCLGLTAMFLLVGFFCRDVARAADLSQKTLKTSVIQATDASASCVGVASKVSPSVTLRVEPLAVTADRNAVQTLTPIPDVDTKAASRSRGFVTDVLTSVSCFSATATGNHHGNGHDYGGYASVEPVATAAS
jgi:hypothetical protein